MIRETLIYAFKVCFKPEFPDSGFSSLDSESETLLLSKSIPRPRPSLVQLCKTRPSPRLRRVLDRETRYFESESLIPLYKRPPKWSDSKLETSKELKFESESETETCLTMYNETESETSLRSRDSQFRVRDERLGKFCFVASLLILTISRPKASGSLKPHSKI